MPALLFIALDARHRAALLALLALILLGLTLTGHLTITVGPPPPITLGVHYYTPSSMEQLHADIQAMKKAGISLVVLPYDPYWRRRSSLLDTIMLLHEEGFTVCVRTYGPVGEEDFKAFVRFAAPYVDWWQVMNELDILRRGDGNLYQDQEIVALLAEQAGWVRENDPDARIITTFTATGVFIRPTLPGQVAPYVDAVGVSIYTEAGYNTAEQTITLLRSLVAPKPVWVMEFGAAAVGPDGQEEQARFILKCIDKFRRLGVPVACIWHWDSEPFAIRDNEELLGQLAG